MNIAKTIAALSAASIILGAFPAFALSVDTRARIDANAGTGSATTSATVSVAMQKAIERGDREIARRITTLNNLNADVQAMAKISADEKSALSSAIQTEIANLTALKAKIDADTDRATLRADIKSIVDGYRIYMLVVPVGRIEIAGDKIQTTVAAYAAFSSKLQVRIAQEQSAGKDVAHLSASLSEMNAKVADASTQAQVAASAVANLKPDQGDKTVMQSNHAALKSARESLKAAFADLRVARRDAGAIVKALAAAHTEASVSASSSATVSQ